MSHNFTALKNQLKGELFDDQTMKTLYSTDASAYREMPLAVVLPESNDDIKILIQYAVENKLSLIPRTAGTSLAGQVVGNGIIVDVSKHFTKILEVNKEEAWVKVEAGVIRDELNLYLKDFGLFFGPETSTSNRCMIGGMVGNNSCGNRSVVYGSTRDHLLEVKAILADGNEVTFKALSKEAYQNKLAGVDCVSPLEHKIYKDIDTLLKDKDRRQTIFDNYPKPSIKRRNTGYAIDLLAKAAVFDENEATFNFCKLIAGSEGTLAFITEIKLNCVPVPPKFVGLTCVHTHSVDTALKGNIIALKYGPTACELMDHYILDCTKGNRAQEKNRFFINGDPNAILIVEFMRDSAEEVQQVHAELVEALKAEGYGYEFPLITGEDTKRVWDLRKAGLGLLANIPGDDSAVPVIEDTAVDTNDLPAFIQDFGKQMDEHGLYCVHYAHAGSGELHLRPVLNMKTEEGHRLFRTVATDIASLVKKYKGSLSGEHGDGRLRGEFIEFMVGEEVYGFIRQVKSIWDENNVFNPGKIVDTAPMDQFMRYEAGLKTKEIDTVLNFDANQGIQRAAELCNGSADCRKTEITGGTMCPSYMATRLEKHTTRARANILREAMTRSLNENVFDSEDIKEVMDLCLSCKGCKAECPSSVDVAKLKAEWMHQYYKSNVIPMRSKMMANVTKTNQLFSNIPWLYNFMVSNPITDPIIKRIMGVASQRSMPKLAATTLIKWYKRNNPAKGKKRVFFFNDEFTNFNDVEIGKKAILLLGKLGYEVIIPKHTESARTFLSKGLLKEAKELANKNIQLLSVQMSEQDILIGIEPSALLTIRDEYLDLATDINIEKAKILAKQTLLIEEFFANEIASGNIVKEQFTIESKLIKVHGHCHQKALSDMEKSKSMLSLPSNYKVELIPSGCCGMAGSFGYEKEHYKVSMKIGELVLFPVVRTLSKETIVSASGTSCRHQIKDGTERTALHPVEVLYDALI